MQQNDHAIGVTSKWRKWVIAIVIVALAITLIALLTRTDEPTYQGKTLTCWLEIYNEESDNSPSDNRGTVAILQMGTNALPCLLRWTHYEPEHSGLKWQLKSLVSRAPRSVTPLSLRAWARKDPDAFRGNIAAMALSLFTNHTELIISDLSRLANDQNATNASVRAVYALAYYGEKSVPTLLAQLADTNAPNRREAAGVFMQYPELNSNTRAVVPRLVRCLEDPDPRVRDIAAYALGHIAAQRARPEPEIIVPALTNCLQADAPALLKERAAWALGNYGEEARSAQLPLLQLMVDVDKDVRTAATNALMKIASKTLTNTPPQ